MKQFDSLIYAPTTCNTKCALFALWERVSKQLEIEALPLTEPKILKVAAVLRASGYRAIVTLVSEAKSRHVKAGYHWDAKLQSCMADVKRAATRAMGPPVRAEEVKLDLRSKLITRIGSEPTKNGNP